MRKIFLSLPLLLMGLVMTGCLGDDVPKEYVGWKEQNDAYLVALENEVAAGRSEYTRFSAEWAPQNSVFIKWHNDRSPTSSNLSPLSTSTVDIIYDMENIDGTKLGNSFSSTTYGDSIYRSQPNQNIAGMWIAMLNMHVGDSVTMIIPYLSGYGARQMSAIQPYTNLIYHVKMKGVPQYEY
ncbi:MAG: FKBP-type peptidyl-prolyl cis-trans isomerase [Muribaculaceae bacterium]|nr:FKBP-type peptidyl-prolyl cis-trans isomerase [Muribaculaceae bacterium]